MSRSYDATNRRQAAEQTRRRIVEAAARRFERDGYAATSLQAVAEDAGVAVPTVYAGFRNKANLLRAVVELTVRGDSGDQPLAARPAWDRVTGARTATERLSRFAALHRAICEREAGVFAQIEAAAGGDAEATALLAEHDDRRYETQSRLARLMHRRGELRPRLGATRAADVIWTLASERTYLALTRDRGWTPRAYERWLAGQLEAALLP